MYTFQRTLNQKIKLSGIGLHTGKNTNIVIKPSNEGTGINFKRVDFENHLVISANVDNVVETNRGTTIGKDGVKIYTIEHFLSALAGLGIDNAMVEIDNIEPPIFDGSSKPFIDMILEAGVKKLNAKRSCITISKPIFYEDDNCKMKVIPSENFQASYFANYSYGNIGKQEYTYSDNQDYIKDLSYARTFCSIGELIFLKENGLIQGGDLNTGVVFLDDNVDKDRAIKILKKFNVDIKSLENKNYTLNNIKLRYDNEPIRHKVLDLIGDFTLLGTYLKGHVLSYGGGHFSNTEFMKKIKLEYEKI